MNYILCVPMPVPAFIGFSLKILCFFLFCSNLAYFYNDLYRLCGCLCWPAHSDHLNLSHKGWHTFKAGDFITPFALRCIKGIVQPEMKIMSSFSFSLVITNLHDFCGTQKEKCTGRAFSESEWGSKSKSKMRKKSVTEVY